MTPIDAVTNSSARLSFRNPFAPGDRRHAHGFVDAFLVFGGGVLSAMPAPAWTGALPSWDDGAQGDAGVAVAVETEVAERRRRHRVCFLELL
jgi:hypothetical protein